MELLDLARRVKRGTRLLDRRFPLWRRVLRKHEDQFNLRDGEFCVLGTLEHFYGRARVLAKKHRELGDTRYGALARALGIAETECGEAHGFVGRVDPHTYNRQADYAALEQLWRAEFEQ